MNKLKLAILFVFEKELLSLKLNEEGRLKFVNDVEEILRMYNSQRSINSTLNPSKRISNHETDVFFDFKTFIAKNYSKGSIDMSKAYVCLRDVPYDYRSGLMDLIQKAERE